MLLLPDKLLYTDVFLSQLAPTLCANISTIQPSNSLGTGGGSTVLLTCTTALTSVWWMSMRDASSATETWCTVLVRQLWSVNSKCDVRSTGQWQSMTVKSIVILLLQILLSIHMTVMGLLCVTSSVSVKLQREMENFRDKCVTTCWVHVCVCWEVCFQQQTACASKFSHYIYMLLLTM